MLAFMLSLAMIFSMASGAAALSAPSPAVTDITSDKAMYSPGETATFEIAIDNSGNHAWSGTLHLQIDHLETTVTTLSQPISIEENTSSSVTMQWTVPQEDFTGYLVKAYIDDSSSAETALDCSSDFTVYPRYGYVADYPIDQSAEEHPL